MAAKFNPTKWIAQELAKFNADNYAKLRAAHQESIALAAKYGMDAPAHTAELIRQADAKFGQ